MGKRWIAVLALGAAAFAASAKEVATLEEPPFSAAVAKEGLRDFGTFPFAGLYTLEPHNPAKPVVVLVHGANGHPGNFTEVARELRSRGAQVWLPYYPSGVALPEAAQYVAARVLAQAQALGVAQLTVIAHSMGGLVALDAVPQIEEGGVTVSRLTTVATPMGGVVAARLGVWFSPNPQANWRDIAAGSAFLTLLHASKVRTPLVVVAVERFPDAGSDGVIPLTSQLQTTIQGKASTIHHLYGTHLGVLLKPETARSVVDAAINEAAEGGPSGPPAGRYTS